jgi:hypothetical protein
LNTAGCAAGYVLDPRENQCVCTAQGAAAGQCVLATPKTTVKTSASPQLNRAGVQLQGSVQQNIAPPQPGITPPRGTGQSGTPTTHTLTNTPTPTLTAPAPCQLGEVHTDRGCEKKPTQSNTNVQTPLKVLTPPKPVTVQKPVTLQKPLAVQKPLPLPKQNTPSKPPVTNKIE